MQGLKSLNAKNIVHARGNWRGFVVAGRPLPGLIPTLKKLPLASKAAYSQPYSMLAPGQGSGRRLLRGNKRSGVAAHAAIADAFAPPLGPAPQAVTYATGCARAARLFAVDKGLRFEAAELIVSHPTLALATRFDATFRMRTGERVLVSWKTGIGARHLADLVLHKCQLAMEWAMLEKQHGVQVDIACIVYLGVHQEIRSGELVPIYKMLQLTRQQQGFLAGQVEQMIEQKAAAKQRRRAGRRAT